MSDLWNDALRIAASRAAIWHASDGRDALSDPIASGDVFAQGMAEGRRVAEAEFASERLALAALIESLSALDPPPPATLAAMMVVAVEAIVSDIVGSAPIDTAHLQVRAEALCNEVSEAAAPALAFNPKDLNLIDRERLAIPAIADAMLPRGTVQVRTANSCAEDGVDSALARFRTRVAELGIAQ